ncbi:hypothetical protein PENPOL_c017G05449 [Penicillium polonicum]|uniref:Uncharacterized protein n=1 Tax=Penicillium polonicum TaxID=60169 RepID=A0A1V6N9S2_PENPO|nr:hypothetical protein PENPOL_c017G05449 [Penicillium polonicum]
MPYQLQPPTPGVTPYLNQSSLNVTRAVSMPIRNATAATSGSRLYVGAFTSPKPEARQLVSRALQLALARPNLTSPFVGSSRRWRLDYYDGFDARHSEIEFCC